jgi:phage-related protein
MAYPYSNHQWSANTAFAVGDVVRANPAKGNTLAFKCIVAGTTDTADVYANFPNAEPAFPFKITQELEDGTVTWEAFEPLAEELLRLAPTAIIDLFEIQLTQAVNGVNDTLRYHPGKNGLTEDIKFGGKTYPAVPVEVDGFEFSAKGVLPRPTLRVANVNNAITSLILLYNPLAAEVRRIRTFAKFIDTTNFDTNPTFTKESDVEDFLITQGGDTLIEQTFNDTADPDAKIVETWYIDRISSENPQFVEFELSPKLDLTNLALPRRTIEEFCPWTYRAGRECPYVGDKCFTIDDQRITGGTLEERKAADVCGKRLSSCQARFPDREKLPFGGFYGARLQA